MESFELQELYRRKARQSWLLNETRDLTEQLGRASERNDKLSIEMLLGMRQGPLRELEEIETGIRNYLQTLPWESAVRANAILQGAAAEEPAEEALAELVARYRRQLSATIEIDRKISVGLGGNRSYYRMFRE